MTDEDAGTLGEHLKRAREEAGLSLRDVAARSGVSFAHIRRLEQGERKPTLEILQKITEALSLNLDEVLTAAGVKMTGALAEPRVYFRRKFGVSEDDAEVMARLIEKYQGNGGQKNGEDIEDGDEAAHK
jgi:transcriptional regulator with XRE-family HTH domain